MDIGGELKELRIDAGLTQRNVADLLMWDIAKVSRIENDKQEVTYREFKQLQELYTARDRPKKIAEWTYSDYQPQHALVR